jgi:transposase
MLHAGLDLSRKKIDVCLLSPAGEIVDEWASPPDADGLRGLAARAGMWGERVRGVVESMNGARFVHDRLEEHGWEVLIADAAKVKGLAPLACKTDKIDARVLASLSARDLVPEIWLPERVSDELCVRPGRLWSCQSGSRSPKWILRPRSAPVQW